MIKMILGFLAPVAEQENKLTDSAKMLAGKSLFIMLGEV
tara:strand:- start:40467 stop:40583 length:117 start_codon:yes stop_codon:yes gene_type:complete